MHIQGLHWVGTRTNEFRATREFFEQVLSLSCEHDEDDFTVFRLPDGSTLELFGPTSAYNAHLSSPVAGLRVDDAAAAAEELEAWGAEIVLPLQRGEDRAWFHFRAPDGFLYELVEDHSGQSSPGDDSAEYPSDRPGFDSESPEVT